MKNRLNFPKVTDADIAFGGYPKDWFRETLSIGVTTDDAKWTTMASHMFFNGGNVDVNRNLGKDYINKGLLILKAVIGSFEPKHEDKAIVCGLILKSLCSQ